jgi:hypothetical protein
MNSPVSRCKRQETVDEDYDDSILQLWGHENGDTKRGESIVTREVDDVQNVGDERSLDSDSLSTGRESIDDSNTDGEVRRKMHWKNDMNLKSNWCC